MQEHLDLRYTSPTGQDYEGRRTVLIVEDDLDTRTIYSTILQRAGYGVMEAGDAGEALDLTAERRPSAILLDIGLPRFGGWGLASVLRGDPDTSDIPIIVITAYDSGHDLDWARQLQVERFLSKPVEPLTVVEEVEQVIGPAERRSGEERRSGQDRRSSIGDVGANRRSGAERREIADRRAA
jgi:CheY-like chemotaxis protein